MTTALKIQTFLALNKRLTYLTGADKGGWSITKVLRLPGSTSKKYRKPFDVNMLWSDQQHYHPKVIIRRVKHVQLGVQSVGVKDLNLPDMTASAVLEKYRASLNKRAKQLVASQRAVVGERSERLWELECLCLQAGMTPEEAFILVRDTVWNKFSGQRREIPQLWSEIQKAVAHVEGQPRRNGHKSAGELKLESYSKFLARPTPTEMWTVEGVWSHEAHGLIAGEAKTFKSFVATDLAVSVASGTPFLGHFQVPKTGPVIMIQEENTQTMMRDRLQKIAVSRTLSGKAKVNGSSVEFHSPEDLPIYLMNNVGFNLTDEEHMAFLESQVQKIQPKLVVLDPLYLMTPGIDENSAVGMTPVLRDLLTIKQKYDVGILIVHHYNKPRSDEDRHPGNRISGTNVFYRWFESALYLEKGKAPGEVRMLPEHRGHAPTGYIHLEFDLGEMGEPEYFVDVEIRKEAGSELRKALKDMVLTAGEEGVSIPQAVEELGISRERVIRLAERMKFKVRAGRATGSRGRPSSRIYVS